MHSIHPSLRSLSSSGSEDALLQPVDHRPVLPRRRRPRRQEVLVQPVQPLGNLVLKKEFNEIGFLDLIVCSYSRPLPFTLQCIKLNVIRLNIALSGVPVP